MSYPKETRLPVQINTPKSKITYEIFWHKCDDHDQEMEATYVDGKLISTSQTGRTRPAGQHNSLEDY